MRHGTSLQLADDTCLISVVVIIMIMLRICYVICPHYRGGLRAVKYSLMYPSKVLCGLEYVDESVLMFLLFPCISLNIDHMILTWKFQVAKVCKEIA